MSKKAHQIAAEQHVKDKIQQAKDHPSTGQGTVRASVVIAAAEAAIDNFQHITDLEDAKAALADLRADLPAIVAACK